ncbi:MAG: hypothetical protein HEQ39_12415 [Rhizobacter sp.]
MNHSSHSPQQAAQAAKDLSDLLTEIADATHFVVLQLGGDERSPLPLIERELLQAIDRCERLWVCLNDMATAPVQTPAPARAASHEAPNLEPAHHG